MTDSPHGPVRKWGNEPRWFPSTSDNLALAESAVVLEFDRVVDQALAIVAENTPLAHPANLGQLDDIEPLDRGSANALGNGIILALAIVIGPFALFGAMRLGFWLASL